MMKMTQNLDRKTMECKKHGEVPVQHTIMFSVQTQPVIKNMPDVRLDPIEKGHVFCMECLNDFLAKKIGICE